MFTSTGILRIEESRDTCLRLWTVHPKYLDTKGLLALWRESLLAQKVLKAETNGYQNHPQLKRFRQQTDPIGAIAEYLRSVYHEACKRNYNFNQDKIEARDFSGQMVCTHGQLMYEWNHLKEKLKVRDDERYRQALEITEPRAHPVFRIIDGEVEDWEII